MNDHVVKIDLLVEIKTTLETMAKHLERASADYPYDPNVNFSLFCTKKLLEKL